MFVLCLFLIPEKSHSSLLWDVLDMKTKLCFFFFFYHSVKYREWKSFEWICENIFSLKNSIIIFSLFWYTTEQQYYNTDIYWNIWNDAQHWQFKPKLITGIHFWKVLDIVKWKKENYESSHRFNDRNITFESNYSLHYSKLTKDGLIDARNVDQCYISFLSRHQIHPYLFCCRT